jgi:DNA-binding CsgD family transcriptional regulator
MTGPTADDTTRIVARVMGHAGIARDLVHFVLDRAGIASLEEHDDGDVTVLVDPTPDDWDAALDAGRPLVLVLSRPMDTDASVDAVACGADAVLHAETMPDRLGPAVWAAAAGHTFLEPDQTSALVRAVRAVRVERRPPNRPVLTGREREIILSIERGDSVKQTALSLGIAHKTVENLQGRLFSKLAVRNRAQAVAKARALHLLDDTPTAKVGGTTPG